MNSSLAAPRRFVLSLLLVATALAPAANASETQDWTRWGGPDQNFRAPGTGIADRWPAEGPRQLWSRELGDGYSTILAEGDRLYTMYRAGEKETVISLDAKTGKTLWERHYDHDPHANHVAQFGTGPRATPLIAGNRIYTIGVAGLMHCLDKTSGEIVWSRDLWGEDFGGNLLPHGYSSSPIEYKDTVIVLVGGEGKSLVAFDKNDGSVVWENLSFANSYATPTILDVDGQEQLVTFMAKELIGVEPGSGQLLWSYPIANQFDQNINPPTLVDGRFLFLSSLRAGSRGLELTRDESGATEVKELWSTRKIQFYHVTSVGDGDYVYGTSGGGSPAFMGAINVKTGDVPWRERGFAKANTVFADGRVIVLDENGKLYLTTATPEGITVHSEAELLDRVAWTTPTIIGKTMYVRDKVKIMALDLGVEFSETASSTAADAASVADAAADAAAAAETVVENAESSLAAAAPLLDNPDEPEVLRILRKVDAATRAVRSVRYHATSKPTGVATNFATAAEGDAVLVGWTGAAPESFRGSVRTHRPGTDEPIEVTAGGNGDLYFLIDHQTKKAYVDMDPNVVGNTGRALRNVQMIEFIHPTPFSDEINADKAELVGSATIEGVGCHEVHVTYAGGQGQSIWFFSKEDFLPRKRIRVINNAQGEGTIEITISDLVVDPELAPGSFEFKLPKGYEKINDFAP